MVSLFRINTRTRKAIFTAVSVVFLLAYVTISVLSYLAYRYSTLGTQKSLQVAVRLAPLNADYRWKLGRAEFYGESNSDAAQNNYEKAIHLNAHDRHYWLDYANALLNKNREVDSEKAIDRAIHLDPTTPATNWEAGNMYLASGNTVAAFHQFREILNSAATPATYPVLQLCWRVSRDASLIVREAIPPKSNRLLQFLNLVIADKDTKAAAVVWNALAQLRQNFDAKLAFPYFDFLIEQHEAAAASEVWKYLVSGGSLAEYSQPENLIVNPGFERPLLNGGFDWRYRQIHSVNLRLDGEQSHSGRDSLAATFSGAAADVGISQMVAVQSDTTFEFAAFAKGHELQGAGGPRFQIQDAYTSESLLLTDDLTDSFNWRSIKGEFHTGPNTSLVVLRIVRVPGNTLIRGKLWIDDLSIRKR